VALRCSELRWLATLAVALLAAAACASSWTQEARPLRRGWAADFPAPGRLLAAPNRGSQHGREEEEEEQEEEEDETFMSVAEEEPDDDLAGPSTARSPANRGSSGKAAGGKGAGRR
jgi:hypothetical protein